MSNHRAKYKILIADDTEMNRELLAEMLEDEFDIIEVENGAQVISVLQEHAAELSLVLLDIVMPEMDGFEVLAYMNRYHWIDDVPVIMISSETSPSYIDRAYEFGATDYISRPFDAAVVHRRVSNTIMLYAKQRKLIDMVAEQIHEKEKSNNLMVTILSHIVEFRNGESGLHVLHISTLTELLLKHLVQKTDRYHLKKSDIALIGTASALHDIGKISIPDEILNKPGRLTAEEFEVMKGHSVIGASMLAELPFYQKEPLVKTAYEICRWHHERYDGGGYPDHLKGEEIPISAQIVALADVYDALTSERCYKKAFSHDVALQMILDGQCGAFSPLLLECLSELGEVIRKELQNNSLSQRTKEEMQTMTKELLQQEELVASERVLRLLECERTKFQFLANACEEIVFTYMNTPPILSMTEFSARQLGLAETVIDPLKNVPERGELHEEIVDRLLTRVKRATPKDPMVQLDCKMMIGGSLKLCRCVCQTMWTETEEPEYMGLIGRIFDIHEEYERVQEGREAAVSYAMTASLSKEYERGYFTLNKAEVKELVRNLSFVFDMVRFVDAEINEQYVVDDNGELHKEPYQCYALWKKVKHCEDCISAKVFARKNKVTKFEFVGEDIYHVIAMYVEIEGKPFSLEMVSKLTDETLISAYGKKDLVESISSHNKKLYIDPVTGIYNRRYYEDQLKGLACVDAVAMLDVDHFKLINDSHGHQVGDIALRLITKTILSCVRSSDATVRFGGDEFIVAFRSIPREIFEAKLELIRERVSKLVMEEYSELGFSVSIGGAYGPAEMPTMVERADALLYEAKTVRDSVRIG